MPLEQDWIKRLVDGLAAAIAGALGLQKKGQTREAAAALEKGLEKTLGMNARLALGLSLEDMTKLACRGEEPEPQVRAAMAEAFARWGELLEESGQAALAAAARSRAAELS